jgi:radical SAM superfamily enzyme YgiQ (UPF0313 family)
MRVAFIRPHLFDTRSADALEPLVFAVLAGLTPPDVDLVLHDERLAPVPLDDDVDLVALTVETYTARRAYQIARHYRSRGIPVVVGGYHPSFLPDEALLYADAVVIGDAEAIWRNLLDDCRRGRLRPIYRAEQSPALDGVAIDRRLFHGKRYPPVAAVQYGRGCRYACDFCSIHAFYGSAVRHRPAAEVVAEIETIGRRNVLLVDDNLFIDRPRARELFLALKPLGVTWGCQVTVDVADDPELLDLMASSGCIAALIGFESLDPQNLRQMNKGWALRHRTYQSAIQRFHDRGIMIYGSFIFGYDHDTRDSIGRTIDFALESKLFLVNFSPLTPTPGSRLYSRLRAEGRLLYDRWWLDPRYRYGATTYRPRHLTPDELTDLTIRARTAFYGYGSIAKRALNFQSNTRTFRHLGLFLSANLVSRREISSKLGRPLGGSDPFAATLPSAFETFTGSGVLGFRGSGVRGFWGSGRSPIRTPEPEEPGSPEPPNPGTAEPQNARTPEPQNAIV